MVGITADSIERGWTDVSLRKVTWPCIWDGPKGEISAHWNVTEPPRNFLLDAKGVIRYRDLYGEDLVQAIEVLLSEMNPRRPRHSMTITDAGPAPARKSRTRSSGSSRRRRGS